MRKRRWGLALTFAGARTQDRTVFRRTVGLVAVLAGCAKLANLEGPDTNQPLSDPTNTGPGVDSGGPSDASSDSPFIESDSEAPVATFTCGTASCVAGKEACCSSESKCVPFGMSCSGAGDAAPALECTTYANCIDQRKACCYNATTGSHCAWPCASNEDYLCRLNQDRCLARNKCTQMNNPPQPGIGRCD